MDVETRETLKKSIQTGVTVLQSIANRHGDFREEILSAIDEVANLAGKGNLYLAKKLAWEKVNSYGRVDAERTLAKTDLLFESLNGQFPEQKAEAAELRDEAKADFEKKRFGDASRKARQACGILHQLLRQDNEEFANSLRGFVGEQPEWKRKLASLKG